MKAHKVLLLACGALILTACAEHTPGVQEPPDDSLPASVIVASEPINVAAQGAITVQGGAANVSYISLPAGTIADGRSARIRNVTANGPPGSPITIFAGGFDPVPVSAAANDELEIEVSDALGATRLLKTTVPKRRPPSIIRTSPPKGRTDVAVKVVPTIVFSEPIDAQSLAGAVRLTTGGTTVAATLTIPANAPWAVEVMPVNGLLPQTSYQIVVTAGVRDLGGSAATAETVPFSTGPNMQLAGRVAFVSDREGSLNIYLANGDGSGVSKLTSGGGPSWSPDGRRIAFVRSLTNGGSVIGSEIHLINVDGSGDSRLITGTAPAWSPDGNRIAFVDSIGIAIVNIDGTGLTRLIRHDAAPRGVPGFYVGRPAWSPDGTRITFEHSVEDLPQRIFVMNADGSQPRLVTLMPTGAEFAECTPNFSPDGSLIVSWHYQAGIVVTNAAVTSTPQTLFTVAFPEISCFSTPSWTTDGSAVTFSRYQVDAGRVDWRARIYVVNRQGGASHQLIPDVVSATNPSYADNNAVWSRPR